MKAQAAHLGMAIANTIMSVLPLPQEVKQVFNMASQLTYILFLLASGASLLSIVLGLLGLYSAFKDLDLGCNKGGGGNGGGNGKVGNGTTAGQGGNSQDGNSNGNGCQSSQSNQSGNHSQNSASVGSSLPTFQNYPLPQQSPIEKEDPTDSPKEAFNKFVRNYTKKLFQPQKLMNA